MSWPSWTVNYQPGVKASEEQLQWSCCHSVMEQNFISTLTQLRKNTAQLSTHGLTHLSCASLQKQDVGQLRYKCFPCTQKEQMCFRLMLTMVLHPPPSLNTFPKGLQQVHRVALVLQYQRHNIGMCFHHGSV